MKNIKHRWSILAQSSSIDRESNNLSIFDIIEELSFQVSGELPGKTVFPINTQLVSLWEREAAGKEEEFKFRMVLLDPDNQKLGEHEGSLRMGPQHKRSRFCAKFQGLPVTKPGTYRFEILYKDETVASVPFEVKIAPQLVKSPITL